jgi:hypothetical protein
VKALIYPLTESAALLMNARIITKMKLEDEMRKFQFDAIAYKGKGDN